MKFKSGLSALLTAKAALTRIDLMSKNYRSRFWLRAVFNFNEGINMKIKAVLFDLDGTLLPMDQDIFIKTYFNTLARKLSVRGYEPQELIKNVWQCTLSMIKNDGAMPNEKVFWNCFEKIYGNKIYGDRRYFDEFYEHDFCEIRQSCGFNPKAKQTVSMLQKSSVTTILATNPIFPAVATEARIKWAGLQPDDFALYTTYENINYCKPNLSYYKEILSRFGLLPEECIMVGNDVGEDMIAGKLGINVFLLTDCLINKNGEDISVYPNGSFDELREFLSQKTENI